MGGREEEEEEKEGGRAPGEGREEEEIMLMSAKETYMEIKIKAKKKGSRPTGLSELSKTRAKQSKCKSFCHFDFGHINSVTFLWVADRINPHILMD